MALTCKQCGAIRKLTPDSEYEAIRLGRMLCKPCSYQSTGRKPSKYTENFPIGKQFGRWTVRNFTANGCQVECICSCGAIAVIRGHKLLSGQSTQCRRCSRGEKSPRWKGKGAIPATSYTTIKLRARHRNIPFTVSHSYLADLFERQEHRCALTGMLLDFDPPPGKNLGNANGTASLDRIDSNKGYDEGNVQWVHKHVNIMKNEYTTEYFLSLCKRIVEHDKNRTKQL